MALLLRGSAALKGPAAMVAARGMSSGAAEQVFQIPNEFKLHKLDEGPKQEHSSSREEMLGWYRTMNAIRRMETNAGELYRAKKIRGFLHLYSGQEAVCVGMKAGLKDVDTLTTAYRCHGWTHVFGASIKSILAELFGKGIGVSNGKGGSMHMYAPNFFGGNGIVGAQVPLAAGLGLAHKYLDNGGISVGLYGDGASNQGQVFEAYNIAKLWDIPSLFVCENNKFGMGTSAARSSANTQYYTRGDYIPGIWVDGMDVLAVKEATEFAREHALNKGPVVLEMETYRYHGHSMSDPDTTYRTRDDIKAVRQNFDPIVGLKKRMVESGMATEEELKKIDTEVRAFVKKETDEALAAPEPAFEQLYADIYAEKSTNVRGADPFVWYSQ